MEGIIAKTFKMLIKLFNTKILGNATLFDVTILTAFYGSIAICFIERVVKHHKLGREKKTESENSKNQ